MVMKEMSFQLLLENCQGFSIPDGGGMIDCTRWKSSQKSIAVVQPRNNKGPGQEVVKHAPLGRASSF